MSITAEPRCVAVNPVTGWWNPHASGTIRSVSVPNQKASLPKSWTVSESLSGGMKLPFVVGLDDSDTPYDVVDALALAPFTTGEQPWARSARLDRLRPGATLLPSGARVLRSVVEEARDSRLAVGEGWTVRAVRWRGGGGEVTVTAVTEQLARGVLEDVVRASTTEVGADNILVPVESARAHPDQPSHGHDELVVHPRQLRHIDSR